MSVALSCLSVGALLHVALGRYQACCGMIPPVRSCYVSSVDVKVASGQNMGVSSSGLTTVAETLLQTLARNVRLLRHQAGWSQEELATRCGLHRTYVGAVERAERNITLSSLEKISQALGREPASLLQADVVKDE